jgi:hypothetical protein
MLGDRWAPELGTFETVDAVDALGHAARGSLGGASLLAVTGTRVDRLVDPDWATLTATP